MARGVRHNPRCAIFNEPPTLRDPKDCNCGAIPPLPSDSSSPQSIAAGQRERLARILLEAASNTPYIKSALKSQLSDEHRVLIQLHIPLGLLREIKKGMGHGQ